MGLTLHCLVLGLPVMWLITCGHVTSIAVSQKMISLEIDKKLKISLIQSLTEKRDKARLASLGLPHAGDWLNVIPSPILSLHVRPQEFRYSVLYRLGAPVYSSTGPFPCVTSGL